MACRAVVSLAVVAALTACEAHGQGIQVSGTTADLRFAIVDAASSRACIDRLTVSPADDPDGPPLWRVIAADPAKCVTSLRYGYPGDAFGQEAGPAPLRADATYRVRISGAGFSVVKDFRVTAKGVSDAGG